MEHLGEPYRTMTIIMAGTVIRESELLALKRPDFDWLQRVIKVRRSLCRGNIDIPKSKRARVISLRGECWPRCIDTPEQSSQSR
jgi:hypothetical protein